MNLREYHAERIAEEARRILNVEDESHKSELKYTPKHREPDEFPKYIWAILDGEAVAYFPERTCRVVREYIDLGGEYITDYDCCLNQSGWGHNFCPNCGARVEEEE